MCDVYVMVIGNIRHTMIINIGLTNIDKIDIGMANIGKIDIGV